MVMVAVVQGMETPPNKKGEIEYYADQYEASTPPPPSPWAFDCRLCPGGGEFEPESFNMEVF